MGITDLQLPTLSTSSLVLLVILFSGVVRAQQQECSITPVSRIQTAHHIFNAQQERALGDVEAEWLERAYQVVHDDGLASHLNSVASRILSQFPPSRMIVQVGPKGKKHGPG